MTLYHDDIMKLAHSNRGHGRLDGNDVYQAKAVNPLCGDECTVYMKLLKTPLYDAGKNGVEEIKYDVVEIKHETRGCALCLAAAARLVEIIENEENAKNHAKFYGLHKINHLRDMHQLFLRLLKGENLPLPSLQLFTPVIARKSRHSCVLLPFDALAQAMEKATAEQKIETD